MLPLYQRIYLKNRNRSRPVHRWTTDPRLSLARAHRVNCTIKSFEWNLPLLEVQYTITKIYETAHPHRGYEWVFKGELINSRRTRYKLWRYLDPIVWC